MFLRVECPGCKAVLQVEEALAGKQGKCIHCGKKIVVPSASGPAIAVSTAPQPPVPFLTEATPEAMIRELHERRKSAVLLIFEPSAEGSYDLADVADNKIKCIATEDIQQPQFVQIISSLGPRFLAPRKAPTKPATPSTISSGSVQTGSSPSGSTPGGSTATGWTSSAAPPAAPPAVRPPESSMVGRLSGVAQGPDEPFEIKGDPLGMTMAEFKQKYARFTPDGRQDLPICSDMPGYIGKADLHGEAWHRRAGIVHARVDNPLEENSPTVAGVKTDLFLYQFIDGKLFRISAWFATDLFHLVSEAVLQKYGKPASESKQPRELTWDNNVSKIVLTRGTVHPRTYSSLHMVHKELVALAESRAPKASDDI
ncbi:MAG: hypothetical protein AB7G28_09345 [Pirellulales bacterium]